MNSTYDSMVPRHDERKNVIQMASTEEAMLY
jgi:hypothetical protein